MKRLAIILAILVMAVTTVMNLPLSWAGQSFMPNIQNMRPVYSGTLWNGRVNGLPRIGSMEIEISPMKTLLGKSAAQFSVNAPALRVNGSANIKGVINAALDGDAFGIADIDPRFAGLQGSYALELKNLHIREKCASGSGTARTDILQRNAAFMQWSGPALSGPITCEDGDIVIALSGDDAQQSVRANIRLDLSGQYRAVIDLISRDNRADAVLPLFGFEKTQTGFRLSEAGRWM